MYGAFKTTLQFSIALSLALTMPVPLFAQTNSREQQAVLTKQEIKQIKYDQQLAYWSTLRTEMPALSHLAFDEMPPLHKVEGSNPLLDSDPFFMRSQRWTPANRINACGETESGKVCFDKDAESVTLAINGQPNGLKINQAFTPILETSEHVFLAADDLRIFQNKSADKNEPGEGVFFIAKRDLEFAGDKPVPVFFFPLPGTGWTGKDRLAFNFQVMDNIVIYTQSKFGLQIDGNDIALMEKTQRQNLVLASAFTMIDGASDSRGYALPKPNTTLSFGLFLSGQTTKAADGYAKLDSRTFKKVVQQLSHNILPEANAAETAKNLGEQIDAQAEIRAKQLEKEDRYDWNYWKQWITVGILYGGTAGLAWAAYDPIDFNSMITEDMPRRITIAMSMIGSVAAASVGMKYFVHRAKFDKLYPYNKDDSFLRKLNQEHKGIMTELAHGLYFSLTVLPQSIRHTLSFLKDHFMPDNKIVHKGWEATIGYQMRQNSHLAMNYKTQYLGWLFGMLDAVQVGVYLLIFGPWLNTNLGLNFDLGGVGGAAAAYASGEMLRNFLSYLQSGAHNYSAEVKFTTLASAEAAARREMVANNKDPYAPVNRDEFVELTEKYLEIRYKAVGLPGPEEFLYDPITFLESITRRMGFKSDNAKAAFAADAKVHSEKMKALQDKAKAFKEEFKQAETPEAKEAAYENMQKSHHEALREAQLASMPNFVLKGNSWGLVQPSLKAALREAELAQETSPSAVGEQTVKLLKWATYERSGAKKIAERIWDVTASEWGAQGLSDSIDTAKKQALEKQKAKALAAAQANADEMNRAAQIAQVRAMELTQAAEAEKAQQQGSTKNLSFGFFKSALESLKNIFAKVRGENDLSQLAEAAKNQAVELAKAAAVAQNEVNRLAAPTTQTTASNITEEDQDPRLGLFKAAFATLKGTFQYVVADATKEVRDIREVLFLMSATNKAEEAQKFLPASWREKAGSAEAAAMGAQLVHRAFYSKYAKDQNLLKPTESIKEEFHARANIVLERLARKDPSLQLQDPFIREIKLNEIMYRLKQKEDVRRKAVNYRPEDLSSKEQKAWEIARSKANAVWEETKHMEDMTWPEMAKAYAEKSGDVTLSPEQFAQSYRYKVMVAREYARQSGLISDDPSESEFVQKVVISAVQKTEQHLRTPKEAGYISRIHPSEREFYEAQVFSRHFIDSYVELSVHTDEHLKGNSPEYPGFGQRVRRALVGVPGGKYLSGFVQGFEALFRNEETSYRANWHGFFQRNIPVLPDLWKNFTTGLRVTPYLLTFSYLTMQIWQIDIPYALWAVMIGINFLNPTLVELNNRFLKNFSIKPIGNVPSKMIYSWIHSTLTNPEVLAIQVYSQPIVNAYDKHIVQPIRELPERCAALLSRATAK